MERILILAAGLCGASGVALSAVAAHAGGGNVGTAAGMLLAHAPAFLAVGLLGRRRAALGWAALVLLSGVVLFSADLLARHYLGFRLFPFAAPLGGMAMIAGWLAIAGAELAAPRRGEA